MLNKVLRSVAKLTTVRVESAETIIHAAKGKTESQKGEQGISVPIFINPRALTFPILVGLAKGSWLAASQLPLEWPKSIWMPFSLCMLLGLLIAISNLTEQKLRFWDWTLGILIGTLNSLVVFGAVVGISSK